MSDGFSTGISKISRFSVKVFYLRNESTFYRSNCQTEGFYITRKTAEHTHPPYPPPRNKYTEDYWTNPPNLSSRLIVAQKTFSTKKKWKLKRELFLNLNDDYYEAYFFCNLIRNVFMYVPSHMFILKCFQNFYDVSLYKSAAVINWK